MSNFLIVLLGALVATNEPATVSNPANQTTNLTSSEADPNDPVEKEYHQLTTADDVAQGEVDKWIRDNNTFQQQGAGVAPDVLNARIRTRFEPVEKGYEDFLKRHPDHARAHLAYGSFLEDTQEEVAAVAEYEKARQLDPKNPTPWNQLANYYCHEGQVQKAFGYYEEAIKLKPTEPIYYQNLGNTMALYRKDAKELYKIDEQQVFDKALGLLKQAAKLAPDNFEIAQDVAQTYYGIRPVRTDEALDAWTNALKIATTEIEKQGVYIHLARFKLNADRFGEVRQHLTLVTDPTYDVLKTQLLKNLADREAKGLTNNLSATNLPPSISTNVIGTTNVTKVMMETKP